MCLNCMSKRLVSNDVIMVLAAYLMPFENASFFQIGDDSLHGSFGDSNLNRDVAKDNIRVARNQDQHMRMIGKECPPGGRRLGSSCRILQCWTRIL